MTFSSKSRKSSKSQSAIESLIAFTAIIAFTAALLGAQQQWAEKSGSWSDRLQGQSRETRCASLNDSASSHGASEWNPAVDCNRFDENRFSHYEP